MDDGSTEIDLRPCCSAAFERRGDAAPKLATSMPVFAPADADLPVERTAVRPPTMAVAVHESSHAIVAAGLGCKIDLVTVEGQPRVEWSPSPDLHWRARVAIAIAGWIGEKAWHQCETRFDPGKISPFVQLVRDQRGGFCDACSAARAAFAGLSWPFPATDEAVVAEIKRIEPVVINFVETPENWRQIVQLADTLLEFKTIQGDQIEEIRSEFKIEPFPLTQIEEPDQHHVKEFVRLIS